MILVFRIITLLLAGFALGLTVHMANVYWRFHRAGLRPPDIPPYYVPAVAAAHSLLIIAIVSEMVHRVVTGDHFSWYLSPVALPAFCLSIYANLTMISSSHIRSIQADVQAHIHASGDTSSIER